MLWLLKPARNSTTPATLRISSLCWGVVYSAIRITSLPSRIMSSASLAVAAEARPELHDAGDPADQLVVLGGRVLGDQDHVLALADHVLGVACRERCPPDHCSWRDGRCPGSGKAEAWRLRLAHVHGLVQGVLEVLDRDAVDRLALVDKALLVFYHRSGHLESRRAGELGLPGLQDPEGVVLPGELDLADFPEDAVLKLAERPLKA